MLSSISWRLSEAVKIMIAVGILFTYGLQLTVTADLTWQRLRNMLIKNPKDHETGSTKEEDGSSLRFTIYYYVMRFFLILGTSKYNQRTIRDLSQWRVWNFTRCVDDGSCYIGLLEVLLEVTLYYNLYTIIYVSTK